MKNLWRLPAPCKDLDEETARNLMVSYAAGSCSPAEKLDFETHCLSCDECRSTLAPVLRRAFSPADEEEGKALAQLYPIGMEAARITRRLVEWRHEQVEREEQAA